MFTYGLEYELQMVIKIPTKMFKKHPSLDKFLSVSLFKSHDIKTWKGISVTLSGNIIMTIEIPLYLKNILSTDEGNLELITQYPRSSIKKAVEDCNENLNKLIIPYLIKKYESLFYFGLFTPQARFEAPDFPGDSKCTCTKHLNIVGSSKDLFKLGRDIYLNNTNYFITLAEIGTVGEIVETNEISGISGQNAAPRIKEITDLYRENICFKPILRKHRHKIHHIPFLGMNNLNLYGLQERKYYSHRARLHIKLPYRFNRYDELLNGISCLPSLKGIEKVKWNQSKIIGRSKKHYNWKHYNNLV